MLESFAMASAREFPGGGPTVNIAFLPQHGPARLLLDRPAEVLSVDYPRPADSLHFVQRTWILYRLVLEDTDDDGKLTRDDRSEFYVTDLNGNGLRRILPERYVAQFANPI